MTENHNDTVRDMYGRRALSYDASHGGWHIKLGKDFAQWLDPQPGETVLDLACGTGLVTIPMATKVGRKGRVVAVDMTPEMVAIGKDRDETLRESGKDGEAAHIDWIIADITSEELLDTPPVKQVITEEGGFDAISLCSALVLLPDQPKALDFWVEKLLKKGGRIVIDTPTEDRTLQYLITYDLLVAIGLSVNLAKGRLWIEGPQSVPALFKSAGLQVEQLIKTDTYMKEIWFDADEETGLRVIEQQIMTTYPWIVEKGKLEDAKRAWPEIWKTASTTRPDGCQGVRDSHHLYVCIGRKR